MLLSFALAPRSDVPKAHFASLAVQQARSVLVIEAPDLLGGFGFDGDQALIRGGEVQNVV
jgi:hypothetical protein